MYKFYFSLTTQCDKNNIHLVDSCILWNCEYVGYNCLLVSFLPVNSLNSSLTSAYTSSTERSELICVCKQHNLFIGSAPPSTTSPVAGECMVELSHSQTLSTLKVWERD